MFRAAFPVLLSFCLVDIPIPPQEPEPAPLIWRGCGITRVAFMHACAEAYTEETGVEIVLSGGGATLGIQAVGEQAADFGGSCRHCLPELKEDKLPLRLSLVAWDALAVVVHPDNPIESISRKQLEQILKQEITDWSELGLPARRIAVITREGKTSGVGRMTRELILGDLDADYGKGVIRLKSSGPVEEMCEQATHAIAVTGVSSARQRDLKILAIDGVQPTAENIASAKYPYFRPLFLAHPPRLDSRQSNFLNWVLGPEGQAIIRSCGTVNLADGIKLVRRFDHYGDPTLITNLPRLQTQAAEFERELKRRAAEELAAARPQE